MWLYLPETISRSLPVPPDSTLDSASLAQRLAVSVSSRTKSMPPKYWQRVVEKGALTTALFGVMLEHSLATSSVAAWLGPANSPGSRQALAQPSSGKTCWCGTLNCGQPSHRRKLNPLFVTWMMGWPLWWTAPVPISSVRVEMESYLSKQRSQLRCLVGDSPDAD
jgi:hypothetical protein